MIASALAVIPSLPEATFKVTSLVRAPPPVKPVPAITCLLVFTLLFNAVCVAVDIGKSAGAKLDTLPNPTSVLLIVTSADNG